jgi:hypothetical protein
MLPGRSMDEDDTAKLTTRLRDTEVLLSLMLAQLSKPAPENLEVALERLRIMFWDAAPGTSPDLRKDGPRIWAFQPEWQARIETLFNDALRLLSARDY